jgi:nicotinamide phosphoribosyltransferase
MFAFINYDKEFIMTQVNVPALPFLQHSANTRVEYIAQKPKRFNLILAVDSYKLSHAFAYPKDVCGMASYIEARTNGQDIMIPFGRQAVLQKYLSQPINREDIEEAAQFAQAHGEPFARDVWEHILKKYDGFMPLIIRGVPEGTPVKSGNAITTIMCVDTFVAENIFWLCSYFETLLLRGEWYPTTIATDDYQIKQVITNFYERTGADKSLIPFALHDFGARGVTCHEQAEIGGAAHLVSFMGSDTIEGVQYANHFYDCNMAAFSVPATEHSVQCSFGKGDEASELAYLKHVIQNLGKPGGIVSIVIDGYDVYRATRLLCVELKDVIIESKTKVVFRPDSGDMVEIISYILDVQAKTFGFTLNAKGFKKINNVGIIQGDGVDHLAIRTVLGHIMTRGFAADNVIFGSGGALLQKRNRDTYKFAQKASAVLRRRDDNTFFWDGIAKNPVTDQGKKSKEGVLTLAINTENGHFETIRVDKEVDPKYVDFMVDIYDHGKFYNRTTLAEVRERAAYIS